MDVRELPTLRGACRKTGADLAPSAGVREPEELK
jgi:hypothetical protein